MDADYAVQYCFISASCAILFAYLFYSNSFYYKQGKGSRFLQFSVALSFLSALGDIFYALREGGLWSPGPVLSYATELLYSLSGLGGAFCWFLFSETLQQSVLVRSRKNRLLVSLPFIVMCLLQLSTPFTGLFFTFEGEAYRRGALYLPSLLPAFGFILWTGCNAAYRSFQKKYYLERYMLRLLVMYMVLLEGSQILQIVFHSMLPFRTLLSAMVFFAVHERILKDSIFTDSLSGIPNRTALDRCLALRMNDKGRNFYFVLMDLDNFKSINDTYSHAGGDRALQLFALALQDCADHDSYFARYGGDEFAAVLRCGDEKAMHARMSQVRSALALRAKEADLPFELNFCYGSSPVDGDNIPDLVRRADELLYRHKQLHKAKGAL